MLAAVLSSTAAATAKEKRKSSWYWRGIIIHMEYFLQDQRPHDHELHLQGRLSRSQSLDSISTSPLVLHQCFSLQYSLQYASDCCWTSRIITSSNSPSFLLCGKSVRVFSPGPQLLLHHQLGPAWCFPASPQSTPRPAWASVWTLFYWCLRLPRRLEQGGIFLEQSSEQPFSMSNVSARVQSWRKFGPAKFFCACRVSGFQQM